MSLKSATIAAFLLLFSPIAFGDQMGPQGDKFYEEAARLENACQQALCRNGYSQQITYSYSQNTKAISDKDLSRLKNIARFQASLWDPSFFELNLQFGQRVFLYEVLTLFKKNEIIGYKIKYSLKAWDLDTCDETVSGDLLENCKSGRISEGSYVSADFHTFFSDEERSVNFRFTNPVNNFEGL